MGLLSLVVHATAGVIRHDVADSNYLAVGNDSDFDAVGRITFTNNSDWASGTLIYGRWLITAGHVVRSNAVNNTPQNVRFTVGGNTYTADQIYLNPGFVSGQMHNGNDIAIVRLSSAVENVDPAELYLGSSELGELATYVGFGRTGTGLTGVQITPATKRGGTNMLDLTADQINIGWSSNVILSDFDEQGDPSESLFGATTPTALEYLPAEKDSGAGMFIEVNGIQTLAGVVSFALFDTDGISYSYGDAIASTLISGQRTWIASVVPETSSYVLVGISFVVGAIAYRRHVRPARARSR